MNNSSSHAKRELEILSKSTPDAIITPFAKEIIALCEKFGNSGQSGGSAPYTASAISMAVKKLMMFETIAPLTGEEDEWHDVSMRSNEVIMFQNSRDSRVFKDGVEGKAYFIEAIVFNGDIGGNFTGSGVASNSKEYGEISSLQYIKAFPFKPKTFYIDVHDYRWADKSETKLDVNGDWWTHSVINKSQLKEVFEYYEKPSFR